MLQGFRGLCRRLAGLPGSRRAVRPSDVRPGDLRPGDLRIGAVSYLNTRPLVQGLAEPGRAVCYDLPSRLADRLAAGDLDVALVPIVELFQGRGHVVVSDACIACRGAVRSVKLLFRTRPQGVRSLALDEGSRTSAILARILLANRFGVRPSVRPFRIGSRIEAMDADAILIIGDRALGPPRGRFDEVWDLGEEWVSWTGLPFVFAVWAARRGFAEASRATAEGDRLSALASLLSQARDRGVERLEAIAAHEAASHGLSVDDCLTYLRDNLHFCLGDGEREAIRLFHSLALREGLVEQGFEFDEAVPLRVPGGR
jgi:chorismate dehydratase